MHIEFKDDAKWLSKFKIDVTSNSNKLYNNGAQQVKVTVSLTPVKGQEITDEQMDSLWIFLIKDGSDYRDLGRDFVLYPKHSDRGINSRSPEDNFKVSLEKTAELEYYAASGFAPHNLLESAPRSRDFYISTLAHGGERYKIYAGITKEEGVEYATCTSRFNSHIELETISSPRRRRSDFTLERVHAFVGATDDGETKVDIDVYYLQFAERTLRIVGATPLNGDDEYFYYEDSEAYYPFRSWVLSTYFETQYHFGFRPGAARDFHYKNISVAINDRPGAMNFLRLELIGPLGALRSPTHGPSRWAIFDQYGNPYGIEMTQKNSGNEIDFRMFDV